MMPQAAGKDAAPDRTLESVLKLPIISRDPINIIVIIESEHKLKQATNRSWFYAKLGEITVNLHL